MDNLFVILWVSGSLLAGILSSYKLYNDRKLTIRLFILNTGISAVLAIIGACFLLR